MKVRITAELDETSWKTIPVGLLESWFYQYKIWKKKRNYYARGLMGDDSTPEAVISYFKRLEKLAKEDDVR